MKHIMKCPKCGKYTMKDFCCEKTVLPKPARYSPIDRFGEYRRKAKKLKEN